MKEYNKKYRDKLKKDTEKWKNFKEKERLRAVEYRKKLQPKTLSIENENVIKKRRVRNRERQKILRDRKKNVSVEQPYKVKQTLFKAVSKAEKGLPNDLQKKKAVIRELIKKYDPDAANILDLRRPETIRKLKNGKSDSEQNVINFYLRDDITYKSPAKSDSVSVKIRGTKKRVIMQKCYLQMTLCEAYQLYKAETDDVVGKTKFCQLRPPNVKLVSQIPHNVCVCQMHSNFARLCSSLKIVDGFSESYNDVLKEMCCSTSQEKCMTNKCINCLTDIRDIMPLQINGERNITITWKQWKKTENGRVNLSDCEGVSKI